MGEAVGFVIFDVGDFTYHYGDGDWGTRHEHAKVHVSRTEAEAELDEIDCEEILRDRLVIEEVTRG